MSTLIEQLQTQRPAALPDTAVLTTAAAGELLLIAPALTDSALRATAAAMHAEGIATRIRDVRSGHGHVLLRLALSARPDTVFCRTLADRVGIDLGVVETLAAPVLVLFDMDSTLITMEVIDELAREAGSGEQVAAITEAAMRGELDFNGSLIRRVATLKGLSMSAIEQVKARLQCNPGVPEFAAAARAAGVRLGLVSGGFLPFARHIGAQLKFDQIRANTLLTDETALTGEVIGEIVNAEVKARTLREWAAHYGAQPAQVWAVGDGANDLLMLQAAGLGVAFRAKPKLRMVASLALDYSDMAALALLRDSAAAVL